MSGYGFVAIVCQAMQELRAVAGAAVLSFTLTQLHAALWWLQKAARA